MNIDIDSLTLGKSVPNSATRAYAIADDMERNQHLIQEINEQNAKKNATLLAGAEANIAQKALFEQQIEILRGQNDLLFDNYSKPKELFDAQVEANKEAKDELKQSRRFNTVMMIIAVISMIAAVAGPIVTILVS